MRAIFVVYPKFWVNAMAIFPVIIVKRKADLQNPQLINHEKIHFAQQLELLIFPFYLFYLLNYLLNLLRYKNHDQAYRAIIFEREAYQHDSDLNYLEKRRLYSWLKHFKN